jgi:hypothetical protein
MGYDPLTIPPTQALLAASSPLADSSGDIKPMLTANDLVVEDYKGSSNSVEPPVHSLVLPVHQSPHARHQKKHRSVDRHVAMHQGGRWSHLPGKALSLVGDGNDRRSQRIWPMQQMLLLPRSSPADAIRITSTERTET